MTYDDPSARVLRRAPWRAALVGTGVCLLVVLAVVAVLAVVREEPLGDSAVWWSTSFALLVLVWVGAHAARTREAQERPHETVMRASAALFACFAGLLVLGLPASLVGGAGPGGLDYVLGGATIGVGVALPLLGAVGLAAAGCVSWVSHLRGVVPLTVLLAGLPLVLLATPVLAGGLALGSTVEGRRGGAIVAALLSTGDQVESAGWLLVGRIAAVFFVGGLLVLVLTARRLKALGHPIARRR